jgi:THO complex subunit 7
MGNRHFAPAPLGGSALGDGAMADAKTSVSKEEDALIKKRLLTQTTTARQGADPPVKRLVKKYLAFCGSLSGEGASAEEVEKHKESFLKELALYEFQLGRTAAVTAANEREMASYAEARGEVDDAVARAEADIRALRDALDAARLDRRHKEEYETLRRLCVQLPSRSDTEAACAHLEAQSDAASRALDLRKKQFALLLHAARELSGELEEDEKVAEEAQAVDAMET